MHVFTMNNLLIQISCCLTLLCYEKFGFAFGAGSETRLEVESPVTPVEEGEILSFRCQVWNLKKGHDVELLRTLKTGTEKMFVGGDILPSTGDNSFVALRQLDDGSTVYFLTIMYTSRDDEGEYICRISRTVGVNTQLVRWNSVNITVLFPPPTTDPQCHNSELVSVLEGTELTLNCSSATGNPPVSIQWVRTGTSTEIPTKSDTILSNDRLFAVKTTRLYLEDDGAIFICQLTSEAFPDVSLSCHVGPVRIIDDPNIERPFITSESIDQPVKDNALPPTTGSGKDLVRPSINTDNCKKYCESTSTSTSFFWIITTVIAGSAALIFLIIFLVCLVKFCKEEGNNNNHRHYIEQQTIEEIYSEVDSKMHRNYSESRLNRDYMALQKQDCIDLCRDVQGHNYIVTGEKRL